MTRGCLAWTQMRVGYAEIAGCWEWLVLGAGKRKEEELGRGTGTRVRGYERCVCGFGGSSSLEACRERQCSQS